MMQCKVPHVSQLSILTLNIFYHQAWNIFHKLIPQPSQYIGKMSSKSQAVNIFVDDLHGKYVPQQWRVYYAASADTDVSHIVRMRGMTTHRVGDWQSKDFLPHHRGQVDLALRYMRTPSHPARRTSCYKIFSNPFPSLT